MQYMKKFCNICAKKRSVVKVLTHHDNNYFVDEKKYTVVRCQICSLGFISNPPSRNRISNYYKSNYYAYDAGNNIFFKLKNVAYLLSSKLPTFIERKILFGGLYVRAKLPHQNVLDIGCGDGSALQKLKSLGFDKLYGTEIDLGQCYRLKKAGITAFNTNDLTTLSTTQRFDVVRMSHVLEHVYNPKETINKTKQLLKNNGILLIGVPNFDSPASKISGKYFCGLQLPTHLFHFNKRSLRKLLEDEGYKIVNMRTTGFSGFSYSLVTFMKEKYRLRSTSKYAILFIVLLGTPIDFVFNIFSKGYIINVMAIKE